LHYQFVPYTIFLIASALMTSALVVYGIRHRHALGTNILALCMLIGTLWSAANALEISALTLEQKLFWANLQYIAYSLGPAAWFFTTCQFTGRVHWIQWKRVLPLLIVPALTIFLVWFDPVWGLVRTDFSLTTAGRIYVLQKQYGPWFYVHFAQAYALNFASIFLAGRAALNRKWKSGCTVLKYSSPKWAPPWRCTEVKACWALRPALLMNRKSQAKARPYLMWKCPKCRREFVRFSFPMIGLCRFS
jgi:hypothetical protein